MAIGPLTDRFTYAHHADGSVLISCDGNAATLLRGDSAASFLAEVAEHDQQEVAARWASKYRPGVTYVARAYPRRQVR